MSNPIKAIGKAFKSVVKVVKKIALPALAIGAVVLTGGAALGILPGIGSVASSLGLSAGLTSVLSAAATSATIGAGLSAVTGGNIIKGATAGFITGGVLGGANAALGAAKGLGTAAAGAGTNTASNALSVIDNGKIAALGSGAGGGAGSAAATAAGASGGLGAAMGGQAVLAPVATSTAPVSSGGIMGFLNRNPIMGGMAIQGLGQGLMASEQNKAAQREREQIAANYGDTSGLPQYQSQGNNYALASDVFNSAIFAGKKVTYDPKTGLKVSNG